MAEPDYKQGDTAALLARLNVHSQESGLTFTRNDKGQLVADLGAFGDIIKDDIKHRTYAAKNIFGLSAAAHSDYDAKTNRIIIDPNRFPPDALREFESNAKAVGAAGTNKAQIMATAELAARKGSPDVALRAAGLQAPRAFVDSNVRAMGATGDTAAAEHTQTAFAALGRGDLLSNLAEQVRAWGAAIEHVTGHHRTPDTPSVPERTMRDR